MRTAKLLCLGALACAGVTGALLTLPAAQAQHSPVYEVREGGLVDQGTFNGYRRYGNSCLACHGPDGAGSSYAPNLTESLTRLSYDDFANTVINGRQNVTATSNNVMPAFGTTEDVVTYLDDIYGYLKARADGKLPRGRPKRFETAG